MSDFITTDRSISSRLNMNEASRTKASGIWGSSSEQDKTPIWVDCDTGIFQHRYRTLSILNLPLTFLQRSRCKHTRPSIQEPNLEQKNAIYQTKHTNHLDRQDAFAILLAAQCPRLHLLGLSTLHGNASCANTTRNSLSILEAIGRRDIPVYPGATKPFCRQAVYAPGFHGETGLDGTTLLPAPAREAEKEGKAVEAMYVALMRTEPGTAWVVATGALTNVALLLAIYPDVAGHIAGLSIMGGAIGGFFTNAPMGRIKERVQLSKDLSRVFPGGLHGEGFRDMPIEDVESLFRNLGVLEEAHDFVNERLQEVREYYGNWTPFAEFNIFLDPEAANAVFANEELAGKTTLIPLDVTHQVLATEEVLKLLAHGFEAREGGGSGDSTLRKLFIEIVTFFAMTYQNEAGMVDGPPLHDPIAVAAALCPEIFDDQDGERFEITVVMEGESYAPGEKRHRTGEPPGECGRTKARLLGKGEKGVRIPRTLDVSAFWLLIDKALEQAEKSSPLK